MGSRDGRGREREEGGGGTRYGRERGGLEMVGVCGGGELQEMGEREGGGGELHMVGRERRGGYIW